MKRRRKLFYEVTDGSNQSMFWCEKLRRWFPLGTDLKGYFPTGTYTYSSNRNGIKTMRKALRASQQLINSGGEPIILRWFYYKGERYLREYDFRKPKRNNQ